MKKFFTTNEEKYQQLTKDESFIDLCEYYQEMEKRILHGQTKELNAIESRKWFNKLSWGILDYQCDNLFAYILKYLHEKENNS